HEQTVRMVVGAAVRCPRTRSASQTFADLHTELGPRRPVGRLRGGGAEELMAQYWRLGALHNPCGKHHCPGEDLALMRTAVQETLAGPQLTPRTGGLLRHAVEAMLARRSRPGSRGHAALRATQARVAAMMGTTSWPGWWWPCSPCTIRTRGSLTSMPS